MTKALSRLISHDGSLTVGQVVPNDSSQLTNLKMNDGNKSMRSWMLQKEKQMESKLELLERKEKNRRSQRIAKDKQILQKRLAEYRDKARPGQKLGLTDEQVIYCREQIKTRSMKSIVEELKYSKRSIENAVRGLTHQHLNDKIKPQW